MEKNTVLAIVLSSLLFIGGMGLKNYFDTKNAPPAPLTQEPGNDVTAAPVETEIKGLEQPLEQEQEKETPLPSETNLELEEQDYPIRDIQVETDLYAITFSTAGGIVKDIKLKEQLENGTPISMVLDGDTDTGTFNLAFGGPNAKYITVPFQYERKIRSQKEIHKFTRKFASNNQTFSLTKSYSIIPGEYVIELEVLLETSNGKAIPLLNPNEPAYTITYGPQIGPQFTKLDGRYEYREIATWGPDAKNGKLKRNVYKLKKDQFVQVENTVNWAAVVGKYFAVVVDPGSGESVVSWNGTPEEGQSQPTNLRISRPARRQSLIEDNYKFYIGPLDRKTLLRYDYADENAFGIAGMGLENAPRNSAWLGWLQVILRVLLEAFYKIIPNYGVAILLLTVVVKAVLFPLTHKSFQSTSKMQAMQPKIKELQEQYKEDKRTLQIKQAEMFKKEGINPLGGCLPMLLQLPIFIALYGLLNRYFPLRGAEFIPGWITDLSIPERIGNEFATPLKLLIVNIPAIRLLPILYLGGQLLMTKITQQGATGAQTGAQQKMLTVGMPIMFFFILYNMPSGLLLYWTAMNIITIIQQLITNAVKQRQKLGG